MVSVMKRFPVIRPAAAVLCCAALGVLSSCDGRGLKMDVPAEIRAVTLGYYTGDEDIAGTQLVSDERLEQGFYVSFPDRETLRAAQEGAVKGTALSAGRYELRDGRSALTVRTLPENARIESLEAVSSDPDILEIVGVDGREVGVRTKALGEVEVTLRVRGSLNTVSVVVPVRVVSLVEFQFYISPYWQGGLNTRLRARPRRIPGGAKSVTTKFTDSVTVCGYCEYYDFAKYGSKMRVARDTVTYRAETRRKLFRRSARTFVRNITPAVRGFKRERFMRGSRIVVGADGRRDTVAHDYPFIVESVILDFSIFASEPFYEFEFFTKASRSSDVAVEGGDEVSDGGSDGDEEFSEADDGRELEREEKPYFQIRYNDFLSEAERQREIDAFREELDAAGYDEDAMSEEEKQSLLDSMDGDYENHTPSGGQAGDEQNTDD